MAEDKELNVFAKLNREVNAVLPEPLVRLNLATSEILDKIVPEGISATPGIKAALEAPEESGAYQKIRNVNHAITSSLPGKLAEIQVDACNGTLGHLMSPPACAGVKEAAQERGIE